MRQMSMSGYWATYGYDARDERVAWVDSAEPGIHYTLRGLGNEILREVHELNGSWSLRKDYLYAGKEHIATIDGAGVKHVHKDHLGSTRLVTSAAGSVVSQHNYWPFGEEMTVTSSPERMRFAGHERDALSSLDYMHARFYAPWGGRFLSVDPGRDYDFHKPQSFNLYAYVRNNPVAAIDPNGREIRLVKVMNASDLDKLLEQIKQKTGLLLTVQGNRLTVAKDLLKTGQMNARQVSGVARSLILEAIASPTSFALSLVRGSSDVFLGRTNRYSHSVVLDMADIESAQSIGGVNPAALDHAMNLFHELGGHALRGLEDTFFGTVPEPGQVEQLIVNAIRAKLGLPLRTRYEPRELGNRKFFLEFGGMNSGLVFTDF